MNLARLLFRAALGRRLPRTEGELRLEGLARPVTVRRDRWGIPLIAAEGDRDAAYGLGFCQGQDRAFQLEGLLRVVRGTLAELIGREGLAVDRLVRRVGFRRAAERTLGVLDPGVREFVEAYARGVTAGLSFGGPRAHEFVLLRASPTAWTAADVLAVGLLQGFVFPSNWDVELARLEILRRDGVEALRALDPAYPEWHPVTAPPGARAGRAREGLARDTAMLVGAMGGGSNNWTLGARRTATGRPLLANDPHLPPRLPPFWYLAHVRTPEWAVAGASFVGLPAFPVAHNGFAAWGITVGYVDDTDLFLEEVGPDGRSVREGDGFVPCEVRVEEIRVRNGPTVVEEVLVTPRGPIVSPALDGELGALSLRATWLEPLPIAGLFRAPRAMSFAEFRGAFAEWPVLPLNVVYADVEGNIGWQLVGQAPRRRVGSGTVPLPGWAPGVGWEDELVPFAEMPFAANPPEGVLATANNQPVVDDAGPFLGRDWLDGYRAARVQEVLASRDDWDVASTLRLQRDVASLAWREVREVVLAVPAGDAELREATRLLAAWDGEVAAGSRAAALFELFVAELSRRIAEAKAPNAYPWVLGRGFSALVPTTSFAIRRVGHLVRLVRERPGHFFVRPWEDELADALRSALRTHAARGRLPWGELRPLTLRHPLGARRPLDRIFNLGPFPFGGDANTVAQASVDPLAPTGDPLYIPSLRAVFDVGKWGESRFALPGGQSGNPLSPHYADQLPQWSNGEGLAIPWSEAEIRASTLHTLRLVPG